MGIVMQTLLGEHRFYIPSFVNLVLEGMFHLSSPYSA
jgi:hypothetical protein